MAGLFCGTKGEQLCTRFGPWGEIENGLEPIGGHDTSRKGVKKAIESCWTSSAFPKGRKIYGENLQLRSRMETSSELDQVPGAKGKVVPHAELARLGRIFLPCQHCYWYLFDWLYGHRTGHPTSLSYLFQNKR